MSKIKPLKGGLSDEDLENISGGVIEDRSVTSDTDPVSGCEGKNTPGNNDNWLKRPH